MDFDVPIQTTVHVVISLIAIVSGAVVAYGFLAAKRLDIWTASFLVTSVLTSVTGFVFFPTEQFTPGLVVGAISLVCIGGRDPGTVSLSPRRSLASGLRHQLGDRVLLQRPCFSRSAVPEGSSPERPGADSVGTAFRRGAARRPRCVRHDRDRRDDPIPDRAGTTAASTAGSTRR